MGTCSWGAARRWSWAAGVIVPAIADGVVVLHVSPAGNDESGTGSADAPFASPERARLAVRALRDRDGVPRERVEVVLAAGVYVLGAPLRLSGEGDSGSDGNPVVYAAAEGQRVVFSAGSPVLGWRESPDRVGVWVAPLADGAIPPRDLYAAGRRLVRARHPDSGWLTLAHAEVDRREFRLQGAGVLPGHPDPRDDAPEVIARRKFVSPRGVLEHWIGARFTTVAPLGSSLPNTVIGAEDQVSFEGSAAFLDAADEWTLLAPAPPAHPLPEAAVVSPGGAPADCIAARLPVVLVLDRVHHVTFRGIEFSHTNRADPRAGYDPQFAAMSGDAGPTWGRSLLPAAIHIAGADHCTIEQCVVSHTGAHAIAIESRRDADGTWRSAESIAVIATRFVDIGGGAVVIGPSDKPGDDPWIPGRGESRADWWVRGTTVAGCTISGFGRVYADAPAIFLRHADGCSIDHNEISDGGYSGIASGWSHENREAFVHAVRITGNRVHAVMGSLMDGAGIYVTGWHPDSLLEGNVVFRVVRDPTLRGEALPCAGLYWDEGSAGWTVRDNVVWATPTPVMFNLHGSPRHPDTSPTSGALQHWGVNYFDQRHPPDAAHGGTTIPASGARLFDADHPPRAVQGILDAAGPKAGEP